VLIAEQLMLLLLDPERGLLDVRYDATDPDRLGAAALLLDLADQRNLAYRNGYITYHPRFPSGHPLLVTAGEALASAGPGVPLGAALDLIETRTRPIARTLLDGLHRRDLLHRIKHPAWLPWAKWRYPLRSLQARNEAIAMLQSGAQRAPLREEGLLILIDCAGRLASFLDAVAHTRAAALLLALSHPRDSADANASLLASLRATLLDE
jgi:Golgi phosphoprotein 3 GPP34